ncbi:MAG: DUF4352 domain-containing protein [Defluviitaleaceae bacterium]|nr:DUF4352 domain-containing protein [Defluviitaleaceae bacterium]
MRKVLGISLFVVLCFVFVGCDTDQEREYFEIGERATLRNENVTLTQILGYSLDGIMLGQENKYLLLEIEITNTSSSNTTFRSSQFTLQTRDGGILRPTIRLVNDNDIRSRSVAPNGRITGTVEFEVRFGSSDLVLIYSPTGFSQQDIGFRIHSTLR